MIKAIFFDIDGTLVSFKTHTIPESTLKTMHALQKKGVKLFVSTGRPRLLIEHFSTFPFDGYVALNGQYCYVGDKVIRSVCIARSDIALIVKHLEETNQSCVFIEENYMYVNHINDRVREVCSVINIQLPPVEPLSRPLQRDILQLIYFANKEEEQQLLPKLNEVKAARWSPVFTDIVPASGDKSVGIAAMLNHFGIDRSETMAFGDGGNDITMFRYVAHGVAMGNAEPEVQQAADYVTTSVDEDGIQRAIQHFGLLDD